nr:alkaline phosphatase D family protein [Pseudomonadota bacterium]
RVTLEVAEDEAFSRIVAVRRVTLDARADWTCRLLVAGLSPSRTYWYRFTGARGEGSRIGRTRTAPLDSDPRDVRFAFVSCQNVTMAPLAAWRRMVHDDARLPTDEQLGFVLHLGDFVYETVWYPEDRPKGYFDRTLNDAVRFPTGEKHDDYHVPVTLEDYRTLYRAYMRDPDLQDARARWPFVAIWDNGEFSDKGWQSLQRFGSTTIPAQTRKVFANQAWFEYLPGRARTIDGVLDTFAAPAVRDVPITRFDADGMGEEPNNRAALASLTGYRAQRWGRHVELILTDQRSYRSDDFSSAPGSRTISSKTFPQMVPFETLQAIDAGKTANGGHPADTLRFADGTVPNFQKDVAPRTLLGAEQKAWFLDRLGRSTATWKVWGNTVATFDMRADPQHLPAGMAVPWPGQGYAGYPRTDHSTAYAERGEVCDFVAKKGLTGFVTLSGDRHSFWAGYTAKALPPEDFAPVGLNFVTGSITSPGLVEAFEYILPRDHPLRALYLIDRPGRAKPEASVNLLLKHGVRSCLDYAAHGDLARAKALSDPGNAPHVEFVDMGGHGYGVVHAGATRFDVAFVCVPRPVAPSDAPDGGPLRYRITHSAAPWRAGEAPALRRTALEGDAELSA